MSTPSKLNCFVFDIDGTLADTDWYLLRHRSADLLSSEKKVIKLICEDKVDDIMPTLSPEDAVKLKEFQTEFLKQIWATACAVEAVVEQEFFSRPDRTRKDFAIRVREAGSILAPVYFNLLDKKGTPMEIVLNFINKNIDNLDKVRHLFANRRWEK